jgi:hypothetical protein
MRTGLYVQYFGFWSDQGPSMHTAWPLYDRRRNHAETKLYTTAWNMSLSIYVSQNVLVYSCVWVYIHTRIHVCMCIYTHVFMCVCVYTHTYSCVYVYTHTRGALTTAKRSSHRRGEDWTSALCALCSLRNARRWVCQHTSDVRGRRMHDAQMAQGFSMYNEDYFLCILHALCSRNIYIYIYIYICIYFNA